MHEIENIGDLVLYKNNQLIAFNKPAGLGVQADKTGDKALRNLAEIYSKSKLHLIHRIDRPVSGLVLFAKTKSALANLNLQFQERSVKKLYLAVVPKDKVEQSGELTHFLRKDQAKNKTIAYDKEVAGTKEGNLTYRVLGQIDNYDLLEIQLHTGRHHQIRAQLAAIGAPVKGDVKYGARRGNRDRSIHLHAWKLGFKHPVSEKEEWIEAPIPEETVWQAFEIKE